MSSLAPQDDTTIRKQKSSLDEKARHEGVESHGLQIDEALVAPYAPSLRGSMLTAAVAFVAGTGFTLFGYKQGAMSALLTATQFDVMSSEVVVDASHPNHTTLQSFIIAIYEVGCLVGALSNLWVGDKLG